MKKEISPYAIPGLGEAEDITRIIDQTVSEVMKIPVDMLRKRTRKRDIVYPRHLAMFFYQRKTQMTCGEIGENLGGYDHATVLHAFKNVNNLRETDPEFRKKFEEIKRRIL